MTANRLSTTFDPHLVKANTGEDHVGIIGDLFGGIRMSTFGRWRDASRALVFGPDLDTATIFQFRFIV